MMTVDDIDRELAAWLGRLKAARQNMLELTENLTYRRLSGLRGFPKTDVAGCTRGQVEPALSSMQELWESFSLLEDGVERAETLRKTMPVLFGGKERCQEIEQLLNGPSIKLPAIRQPLAQRGLLAPLEIENAVTPQRLLEAMNAAFTTCRDVVLRIEEVWNRLDTELAEARAAIAAMPPGPVTDSLNAQIDDWQKQVTADPLAPESDFVRSVKADLAAAAARAEQARRDLARVDITLAGARDTVAQLQTLNASCDGAWQRCQELIEAPPAQPRKSPALIGQFIARLDAMHRHLADGSWNASQVMTGLDALAMQAKAFQLAEQTALEAYQALLAERDELRGLLAVYKRRAEKRGCVEDPGLSEVGRQAEQLLFGSVQTPLARARELVMAFRERVERLPK